MILRNSTPSPMGRSRKQIEDFKKPLGTGDGQSDLSILIVKDMLLTGFDAPVVGYVPGPQIDGPYPPAGNCPGEQDEQEQVPGYIVDYFGLSDYLTEALDMFSTDDVAGALVDLKEEIPKLRTPIQGFEPL